MPKNLLSKNLLRVRRGPALRINHAKSDAGVFSGVHVDASRDLSAQESDVSALSERSAANESVPDDESRRDENRELSVPTSSLAASSSLQSYPHSAEVDTRPTSTTPLSNNANNDASFHFPRRSSFSGFTENDQSSWDAAELREFRESIDHALLTVDLFFTNQFNEAKRLLRPKAGLQLYDALAYSAIVFLQACMTFDSEDVKEANRSLQVTMDFCDSQRKKTTVVGKMWHMWQRPARITEEQVHAELCYAECGLMKAMLMFMSDDSLVSFVRAGWKIHQCYNCYKECMRLVDEYPWEHDDLKAHFESGVRLGYGSFNLVFSSLPPRVLSILRMVGFSGDREVGMRELDYGMQTEGGLRSIICRMTLISWNTITCYIIGNGEGDIGGAARLLQPVREKYPNGALVLFYTGRIEQLQGNFPEAISYFDRSISVQTQWRQFHHMNYWEMSWCYAFMQNWLSASRLMVRLYLENDWSKAMCAYVTASLLIMADSPSISTGDLRFTVDELMGKVPELKQRIAGHSLPIEKFVVKKARRYFNQGGWLLLPALEVGYIWSGWVIVGRNSTTLRELLQLLDRAEQSLRDKSESDADVGMYSHDNYCLLTMLRGCSYSYLEQFDRADACFNSIIERAGELIEDKYIAPYTLMEMAAAQLCRNRTHAARKYLADARKISGFSMESRFNFRARALEDQISLVEERKLNASSVRLQWYTPPTSPAPPSQRVRSQ